MAYFCDSQCTSIASFLHVSTTGQRYRGSKPYSVDPKYRFAVPPAWRPAPGEVLYLLSSRAYEMPMLKVLTQEGYDERVAIVKTSNLSEAKKRQKIGSLAMLCREVTINDQGKLLIPKDLSEQAGIKPDSDIMLAGREEHFEVWNLENYQRYLEIERNQDDADELGIL